MSEQKNPEDGLSLGQTSIPGIPTSPRSNVYHAPTEEKEDIEADTEPYTDAGLSAGRSRLNHTSKEKSQDIIHTSPVQQSSIITAANDPNGVFSSDATPVGLDPFSLSARRRENVSRRSIAADHPSARSKSQLKKYYTAQNELIDAFLNSADEERLAALDSVKNGPKVKFAINASFGVNFCLFCLQLYAAISTGSLSLFATAADAFMDLVSSFVMWITSRTAKRESIYKYPVGRTRLETVGIIMFCSLMTTVAVELIIESGRSLGEGAKVDEPLQIVPLTLVGVAIFSKLVLFIYCFSLRRYPAARIFSIDHRNDLAVNIFGLVMSIVGDRFVWWLDPFGSICIALLILVSWVSTAFEHVWLLVGKTAPKEFVNKVVYLAVTHDNRILKVDTVRAYHAGQRFYVELDIILDATAPLRITHDVSQTLQRKLEGLADVERAFVHVDYEDEHDVKEEHKPVVDREEKRKSVGERIGETLRQGRRRVGSWVTRDDAPRSE
ncbi:MAG: hypothetical protein M1820_004869 [Bogoriella megaspora]|nr:MAG: hypothetical protein M1820_004869 [Bogoriella megaspora]